jgi:hypothetical protein
MVEYRGVLAFRFLTFAGILTAVLFFVSVARAEGKRPRLYTNQNAIEDAMLDTELPLGDIKAMLEWVLSSLPERVKVYPTESYYYFNFYHQGVRYAGNVRLDAKDRDEGKLHFAFFEDLQEWTENPEMNYRLFGAEDGVKVERVEKLVYRVTVAAKSVVFELNDLSKIVMPEHLLAPDEKYLGPVFDESGMQFFLVFNPKLKMFLYILNETGRIPDQLRLTPGSNRIFIGSRTGFAYYLDFRISRKILIGVFDANSRVNNAFDGPFDQLPDSFVEGDALRDAIIAVEPSLKGKIDRFGGSDDGSGRFLVAPYTYYRTMEELYLFHQCATERRIPRELYYQCFVVDSNDYGSSTLVPIPLKNLMAEDQKKTAKRKTK